jgi:protein-S-isoprenylcysteine O-methyltransferase Ste14
MDDLSARRPTAVPWPPMLLMGALGCGVLLGRVYPLSWPGLDDLPARIVGYGLGMAGLALTTWGVLTLVRARTNVLPHKAADRLITDGAYGFRRNPIYMGDVLMLLGLAQLTLNIWFAILAPPFALALYALAIRPEERHLEARFGEPYLDYKARTRRWF